MRSCYRPKGLQAPSPGQSQAVTTHLWLSLSKKIFVCVTIESSFASSLLKLLIASVPGLPEHIGLLLNLLDPRPISNNSESLLPKLVAELSGDKGTTH